MAFLSSWASSCVLSPVVVIELQLNGRLALQEPLQSHSIVFTHIVNQPVQQIILAAKVLAVPAENLGGPNSVFVDINTDIPCISRSLIMEACLSSACRKLSQDWVLSLQQWATFCTQKASKSVFWHIWHDRLWLGEAVQLCFVHCFPSASSDYLFSRQGTGQNINGCIIFDATWQSCWWNHSIQEKSLNLGGRLWRQIAVPLPACQVKTIW